MIEEPFTDLAESSIQMHELFLTYVAAGFSVDEALKLIAYIIVGAQDPREGKSER